MAGRKMVTAATLITAACIMLSSCSCFGSTEETEGPTETIPRVLSPTPVPGVNETSAVTETSGLYTNESFAPLYLEILNGYEEQILTIERSGFQSFEPIAILDITGDGVPELFVCYDADDEAGYENSVYNQYAYATLRVYCYNAAANSADQMLEYPSLVNLADEGTFSDITTLDNGNILFHYGQGTSEGSREYFVEYRVVENRLEPARQVSREQVLTDPDEMLYELHYYSDGTEITADDYTAQEQVYINATTNVIMSCPFYYDDMDNGPWGNFLLSLDTVGMTYESACAELL